MKTIFITLIVLIATGFNVFAGEKSHKEKNGDRYFFVYSFEKAIDSYMGAKHLSTEGQRRLAESYQNLGQNVQAAEAYSKLLSSTDGVLPEDYYNYAMILKKNGKYEESNIWMDKFVKLKPEDLRGKDYAANHNNLNTLSKDENAFRITHLDVNTEADDFGANYFKDKIVFSSSRTSKMHSKKYKWTGKPFLDIYVSVLEGNQMKSPSIFDKSVNGKMHDGPASFSKDGSFMAFTKNNYDTKRKDTIVELQIYFSTFKDGKWSTPEPFILNNTEYSVGHPCLSADGNTMYFASDMPGGFGGADIYRVTKVEGGGWGKAENLGNKINTEGDEAFPFYEETNEVLFFASDGRYGLGGYDIFICAVNGAAFGNVINAGFPLNTTSDDFAIIVDEKLNTGYFSSNRTGGSGGDDIYAVDLLKELGIGKKIKGIAKNSNGIAIPKTFISLLDDKGNILETVTTKDDGAYVFLVASDKNFKLTGKKENYIDGEKMVGTFGKDYIVVADVILLTKQEVVAEKIVVDADLGIIVELNPIYFDYDKFNIRPDAATELDKIVKVMNEYPAMVVDLRSYTDCRATVAYNQVLSDKRAQSSVNYIKQRITKPERISGSGYSETKSVNGCECEGAVVSSCSEAEYQKNRRTEFIIRKK